MPSAVRSWCDRYAERYGLPQGRSKKIGHIDIQKDFKWLETLDGDESVGPTKGGLNQGVFLVIRRSDGKKCVQKRIDGDIKILRREIHLLHHLRHPNVIEFLDAFITKDTSPRTCSLFIEFCDAGGLDNLIQNFVQRDRKIPERFIWHTFGQVASALQYLHHGLGPNDDCPIPYPSQPDRDEDVAERLGQKWPVIIHRDIKPANIFMKKGSYVKIKLSAAQKAKYGLEAKDEYTVFREYPQIILADFGLAIAKEDGDFQDGELCGTPGFFPPEVPDHTALGDIWQLGGLVLGLSKRKCTGPVPNPPSGWDPKEWWESSESHQGTDRPVITPGYSQDLEMILHMCLANEKEYRPYSFRLIKVIEEGKMRAKQQGFTDELPTLPKWATS